MPDPAPPLHFISARSLSCPHPCLPIVTAFPRAGTPTTLLLLFLSRLPPPPSVRSPAIPRQSLLQVPSPSAWTWGCVPPVCQEPLLSSRDLDGPYIPGSCVHLWPKSICPPPTPLFLPRGHRARHQTHPPAVLGADMMGGGGGCMSAVKSTGSEGSPPRRGGCRASKGSGAGWGRGSRAERYCPSARLASCRPGPWASSGAPCLPPLLFLRATPGFRSPSSTARAAGLALGSLWGEEVGGRGRVPPGTSLAGTALVVRPYTRGGRRGEVSRVGY